MVSQSAPHRTGDESEKEAAEAIAELITDLGLRATLAAVLASALGPHLDRTGSGESAKEIAKVILRQIVFDPNPQLCAEIMALGAGVILGEHTTMTRIAAKHGVTKAAISKRVVAFAKRHRLSPSQYMRSEKDRKTYSESNRPRT